MTFRVRHTTKYQYSDPVLVCHNEVHLTPRAHARQSFRDFQLHINPHPANTGGRVDYFGNGVNYFAITEPHQQLTITSESLVTVSPAPLYQPKATTPWDTLRDGLPGDFSDEGLSAIQFMFNSPLITRNNELADYAAVSFTPGRPILEAAMDLMARIHREFKYDPSATNVNTPLGEVMEKRAGVCQDLAHVGVGCLRSLGLAARYVSGYLRTLPPPGKPRLVGADQSHAWFSVYCGGLGWVDMDPTNNVIASSDHISLGWGRDYSDVCPIRGVFVGGGKHTMAVSVDVAPEEQPQTV